ncbi:Peptidase family M20/M25/M40 [Ruegeria halocynthiae]|uniref:Peptidase family M20/M25/M40 n=1 Tax=Ruegeria halocynthiae TaxID=985054 RepID=A0A1H3EIU7_9RHOB|nr:Peptidase family M20/M25/M40 [Ruegeria halocynthiae]
MNTDSLAFRRAQVALRDEWERDVVFVGLGGSLPVAGYFQDVLELDTMLIGFAKENDAIHSPNEKYDVESFRKGIRSWIRILGALAP